MSATAWLLLLAVVVAGMWLVGAIADLLIDHTPPWRTALAYAAHTVRARAAALALLGALAGARFRTAARRGAPTR